MTRIEVRPDEMYLFDKDVSLSLSRIRAVEETRELVNIFVRTDSSNRLAEKMRTACTILIIGPGPYAPELDLFFGEEIPDKDGNASLIIPDNILKIVLVERSGAYDWRQEDGIFSLISRIPNIEVHQRTTIREYCQNTTTLFDLILYLRTDSFGLGQRPECFAEYLKQLLCIGGLALITGDQEGIERLVISSAKALTAIVRLDNLPEGGFKGGFMGHSGVVLRSNPV